jgi:hypothetical protein
LAVYFLLRRINASYCITSLTTCLHIWFRGLGFLRKEFVLREAIDDQLKEAYDELKMRPVDGEAGEPTLDFTKLFERFQIGQDFAFSVTIALQSAYTVNDSTSPAPVADSRLDVAPADEIAVDA